MLRDLGWTLGEDGALRNNADGRRFRNAIMGLPGTAYSFAPGRVHNVHADVITDHGDIGRIEVAYAVLCAAGAVS